MLDNSACTKAIILAILIVLALAVVMILKQQSAIRSLQWRAGSPFQFITLCQRCLEHRGWVVEQRVDSFFELVAKQDGLKIHISCRPSHFGIDIAYLREVYTCRVRAGLATVAAITYDQPKPGQRGEAARKGVLLMCYNEMDSLAAQFRCADSFSTGSA
jgi:hypothetical protein